MYSVPCVLSHYLLVLCHCNVHCIFVSIVHECIAINTFFYRNLNDFLIYHKNHSIRNSSIQFIKFLKATCSGYSKSTHLPSKGLEGKVMIDPLHSCEK